MIQMTFDLSQQRFDFKLIMRKRDDGNTASVLQASTQHSAQVS